MCFDSSLLVFLACSLLLNLCGYALRYGQENYVREHMTISSYILADFRSYV